MTIETVHLRLAPFTPSQLLALIESEVRFEECFGLPAADGLRGFLVSDEVSPAWVALLQGAVEADPWLYGFAVVHPESDAVIGCVGFKGPPDENGVVEIAYSIAPGFQGRGLATEATEALTAFAFDCDRVRLVRAHTLPTTNASMRVLSKCGFKHTGELVDPEDGLVWRWERTRDSA